MKSSAARGLRPRTPPSAGSLALARPTGRQADRLLLAIIAAATLVLAACGDDGDDGGAVEASASASASGSEDTTTTAAVDAETTTTAASAGAVEGEDAEAVATAVGTLFDTSLSFDEKVALVEGGEALRASHDAYLVAGDAVGGITVEATGVAVEGTTATVTYRVLFAGTEAYRDLTMTATKVGDAWVIPTDQFCGFLASARTPCT